ncbi:MAG TPA: hypothetical protein VGJ29_16480 [Vicinamibacterales bacterium]|jgi:hypothetical protein
MRPFLLMILGLSLSAPAFAQPQPDAQTPRPPRTVVAPAAPGSQTPPATVAPAAPASLIRREGQPLNIKVEVTITDQRGGTPALKKTVTVVTGDSMNGYVRSSANYSNLGNVPLNVDTEPQLLADGKIRLHVNLEYELPAPAAIGPSEGVPATERLLRMTQIRENLALILESGKPIVAAQSADPVGDRQVTIEVKATILR